MSIKLMTFAWDLPLTGNKKLILMALSDFANDDGKCWPCIETIATKTGASVSTVKRLVKDLITDGYLHKEPQYRDNGSQTSNVYIVTPVQNVEGVQNDTPPPGQNDTPPQGQNVPPLNRHTNRHKEPSSKKTNKKTIELYHKSVEEIETETGLTDVEFFVCLDALKKFEAHRKAIKKPAKTTGPYKLLWKNLIVIREAGISIDYAVQQMVENEWQTVKLEYLPRRPQSNGNGPKAGESTVEAYRRMKAEQNGFTGDSVGFIDTDVDDG